MTDDSIHDETVSNFCGRVSPSLARAVELWQRSPEEALSGGALGSIEGDPEADHTQAIVELAGRDPERFEELVEALPEPLQDIFFQHYLLGRTQTQIARLIDWSQSSGGRKGVSQGLRIGWEGMCAVIAWGGEEPTGDNTERGKKLLAAYAAMERFRGQRGPRLTVRAPRELGNFTVRSNHPQLAEFFAPGTTDGPVRENR